LSRGLSICRRVPPHGFVKSIGGVAAKRSTALWAASRTTFWTAIRRITTFRPTFSRATLGTIIAVIITAAITIAIPTRAPTATLRNQRHGLALMDISPATAKQVQQRPLLLRDQRHNLRRGSIKRARSNNFLSRRIVIRSVVLQQLDGQGPKIGISHV
jgi:hypothetical protein